MPRSHQGQGPLDRDSVLCQDGTKAKAVSADHAADEAERLGKLGAQVQTRRQNLVPWETSFMKAARRLRASSTNRTLTKLRLRYPGL